MSTSDFVTMQQRRGLKANLPATAPDGQLLIATDTKELFFGTGTGVEPFGLGSEHQTRRVIYDDTHAVYADGVKGNLDPKGREGWYFSNAVAGSKINWYYYDPTQFNTTVANFAGTYAIVTIDTNRVPYFAVYTAGTEFGWYKSRRVYSVQSPSSVVPGKYLIYTGVNPSVYPELPRIQFTFNASNTALNNGAFASSETIAYVTLQSDSGVTAGQYQFCVHDLGFITNVDTYQYQLKTKSDTTKVIQIPASLSTWTIPHNMGKRPSVTTVDSTGQIIQGQVIYNSDNQITIYFTPAVSGTVYLN